MTQRRARHPILSPALFIIGAVVAAFLVSAIAGIGTGGLPTSGGVDARLPDAPGGRVQADVGSETSAADTTVPIRVEVLNGSGAGGLARDATQRLRGHGFDVVFFGNASRFDYPRSVVLDRTGDTLAARIIAAALGIDSIASTVDPRLLLDVTVVLGSDWPPPVPERLTPMERLRRLLAPGDTEP